MNTRDLGSVGVMLIMLIIVVMFAGACGSTDDIVSGLTESNEPTAAPAATDAPVPTAVPEPATPVPTAAPVATDAPVPTAVPEPEPPVSTAVPEPEEPATALVTDAELWRIDWNLVHPTYLPDTGPRNDPFFHIHTSNEQDGFYLSFEMFTVWGGAWSGDLGTFEISCLDVAQDTGICVHLDPDGPGPSGDIAADFGATGEMTIHQLDQSGYRIDVHSLTFSDGTAFAPFEMFG